MESLLDEIRLFSCPAFVFNKVTTLLLQKLEISISNIKTSETLDRRLVRGGEDEDGDGTRQLLLLHSIINY